MLNRPRFQRGGTVQHAVHRAQAQLPVSVGDSDRAPISPTDLIFNPDGAKPADISKNLEQAPEIIPLRDPEQVEEKGITGKAARYVRETNQLFVNLTYSAVAAAQEDLGLLDRTTSGNVGLNTTLMHYAQDDLPLP